MLTVLGFSGWNVSFPWGLTKLRWDISITRDKHDVLLCACVCEKDHYSHFHRAHTACVIWQCGCRHVLAYVCVCFLHIACSSHWSSSQSLSRFHRHHCQSGLCKGFHEVFITCCYSKGFTAVWPTKMTPYHRIPSVNNLYIRNPARPAWSNDMLKWHSVKTPLHFGTLITSAL